MKPKQNKICPSIYDIKLYGAVKSNTQQKIGGTYDRRKRPGIGRY